MMKRIIAAILCLSMVLSIPAYAVEPETEETVVVEETVMETQAEEPETVVESELVEEPEPETTAAEETIPETTAAEETVPETTVAEETVPETTIGEETIPETTVAEETVPETTETVEEEETLPAVGDKIWINRGSVVYKTMEDAEGHETWLKNYQIEIVAIISDEQGAPAWYEYTCVDRLDALFLMGYKYVKAENTSVEEPEETVEQACTCSDPVPEKLSQHTDSCPRKQYIKTMFEGKTAEEICTSWETYDEATRNDLLEMLEVYNTTVWEELKLLIKPVVFEEVVVLEDGTTVSATDGVKVAVQEISSEKASAILAGIKLDDLSENSKRSEEKREFYFLDIEAEGDGTTLQIDNILSDNENKSVSVIHLLDSLEAISNTVNGNLPVYTFEANDVQQFEKELNAAALYDGIGNCVYYTVQPASIDENGQISFGTASFSTFIFVVDFEYNGLKYSMVGNSEVNLSEILSALELSYDASQVTAVEFSDAELLRAEKENEDWKITSLESFDTIEWMMLYFDDGSIAEIRVTDPTLFYYINNTTKWDMGRTDVKFDGNRGAFANTTVKTNTTAIATTDFGTTASTISVFVSVPKSGNAAVRVASGTAWPAGSYVGGQTYYYTGNAATVGTANNWTWAWVWDGTYNYAVLNCDNINEYKTFEIPITVSTISHTLKIHLIPDNVDRSKLKDSNFMPSNYEIRTLAATLYNYDGNAFNDGRQFQFSGVSQGVDATRTVNTTGMNSGGSSADMGILNTTLKNGLPTFALGDVGDDYLFSTADTTGKQIFNNAKFEFIYNTTDHYYTYNSLLNHAQYNASTNTIELYKESLSPTDALISNGNQAKGGFYPFANIKTAFRSSYGEQISPTQWASMLTKNYTELGEEEVRGTVVQDLATTSTASTATTPVSSINMHYGIHIDSLFYLPENRTWEGTPDGQQLVFTFNGDDDLWVYIDGHLVLDIGGGHTPVQGSFNITTGTIKIDNAQKLVDANTEGTIGEVNITNDSFLLSLKEDQMHRLQIFYLERCSGESNCYMHFNLPLIPDSGVQVSKEVVADDGLRLSIEPAEEYMYRLYVSEGGAEYKPAANMEYTLNMNTKKQTDDNGVFKLKNGDVAIFEGITRFAENSTIATKVYVEEILDNKPYIFTRTDVKINGGNATVIENPTGTIAAAETEIQLSSAQTYAFKNYILAEALEIEKQVIGGTKALFDPNQTFAFDLTFDTTSDYGFVTGKVPVLENGSAANMEMSSDYKLSFDLAHGDNLRLERVPVNVTYTLEEVNPDTAANSFDAPVYHHSIGSGTGTDKTLGFGTAFENTMTEGADNKVLVTNCQRADLIIDKNVPSGTVIDEDQTFLFHIKGLDDHNKDVDLNVTVMKDGSVRIPNLIVGRYKVTENSDWSWRYELEGEADRLVEPFHFGVVSGKRENTVNFLNKRTEEKWLDGNSWCQNIFGDTTITRKPEEEKGEDEA